jgi:acetyl-CoA acetyltransferase
VDRYVIAGLGVTSQGRLPGSNSEGLAWEACELALQDAGLARSQVDGYLFQPGIGGTNSGLAAVRAGLPANVILEMQSGGATAILALSAAIGLIEAGVCSYVLCAHGTNAATRSVTVGGGRRSVRDPSAVYGYLSPGANAAMWASAYFAEYSLPPDSLGPVAVALRSHGAIREDATMFGRPVTLGDYANSPFIVEPLRKLDYCLVTDGGAAYVVTTEERARDLRATPVHITGIAAQHSAGRLSSGKSVLGAADMDVSAMRAGVLDRELGSINSIDVFQLYDAFTVMVAQQLEAWGLCGPGEAPEFAAAGNMSYKSATPCNTSGTEHSWSYLQGFTHISEAVRQLRGEAATTQVPDARTALVTGVGSTDAGISHAALSLALA